MPVKALVSIEGVSLPIPSTYVGTTTTIVDSGRNVKGVVIGSVVRDDVGKIEMTWKYITPAEWSTILKLFSPTFGGNFYRNVTFYDQLRATWITRKMYVSDRATSGAYNVLEDSGAPRAWQDAKLSLVEV